MPATAASAANTQRVDSEFVQAQPSACWGAIWRSPDRLTRAIVTASSADSPSWSGCPGGLPCGPHFTATQCLPWAQLGGHHVEQPVGCRVRHHPVSTPHPHHRGTQQWLAHPGSGHSSIIWARPSTLAAKLSTTAADVTPVPEITPAAHDQRGADATVFGCNSLTTGWDR